MNFVPPLLTAYTVGKGDKGVVPWAVQRALNDCHIPVMEDGFYGPETKIGVRQLQQGEGLKVDGEFGPYTSRKVAELLEHEVQSDAPIGLIRGLVTAESNGLIGAVNTSVPGGTDCGYTQRRVLLAEYNNEAAVKRAFDGLYQMNLLAKRLQNRHDAFFGKTGAKTHVKAWRLATLDHNYPAAAQKIAEVGVGGLTPYYKTPQKWVEDIGATFPDEALVRTPLEWCQFYALGSRSHGEPGRTWQYVDLT